MKHVYYVVVLVIRPQGSGHQLLMARRAEGKYMVGTWQLISGGLEQNETAWQGALREMREETGLAPSEFYRLSTVTTFYRPDNDSLNIAPMFCAIVEGDADVTINTEHTAFKWVDVEEAASRLMWPRRPAGIGRTADGYLGPRSCQGVYADFRLDRPMCWALYFTEKTLSYVDVKRPNRAHSPEGWKAGASIGSGDRRR